jgi:uncharacterized membrane protein
MSQDGDFRLPRRENAGLRGSGGEDQLGSTALQSGSGDSAAGEDQEEDARPGTIIASWSGPLPHPAALHGFNEAVENGAERVFAQFELEADHRRKLETFRAQKDSRRDFVAQISAAMFALSALGVTAFALYRDHPTAAGIIGGLSIAGVVGAFLWKRHKPDDEAEEDE